MVNISPSALTMPSAMDDGTVSALTMFASLVVLFSRGREHTMPDYHELLLWPKRCAARLQQNHFLRKINDLDAEIIILAAVKMQFPDAETRSEPCGCTAHFFCALRRPQRCADAMLHDSLRRPSGCLRKRRKYSAGQQNASSLFIEFSVRISAKRRLSSPTGVQRRAT